jgi:hypothetical protein
LPPPPVARKSVRLPGVAQLPDDEAGSVAAKFAASNVFNGRSKAPSNAPDTWPGGTASIKTPWSFARLVRSPKHIAMAAGVLVLLVVVIVFATGGQKPAATPAPAKVTPVAPAPIEPANVVTPVEPVDTGSADNAGSAAKPPKKPKKPAVKAPPKRVATQPAVKPATKPPVKPATKPATKPTKPPAKKWDPNTLFPTRK